MARPRGPPPPQVLRLQPRRPPPRRRHEGHRPPKTKGAGQTIADLLCAENDRWKARHLTSNIAAARFLIAVAGSKRPQALAPADILEAVHTYESHGYSHATKALTAYSLRFILSQLWEFHGAPKLDRYVPRYARIRPRNVTATRDEIDAMLANAKPSLKLWLLLCSDLAMRSGTAHRLTGANYNPGIGIVRFRTKGQSAQALPVTDSIRAMLADLDHHSAVPYVWQLRARERTIGGHNVCKYQRRGLDLDFRALRLSLGITRRITPHDLRRTAAVAMLEHTHDIRAVKDFLGHDDLKTTLWYLDHDATPVNKDMLEAIKRPFLVARKEQSA